MKASIFILNVNPFFESYLASDWLGKFIFLALYALSIISWTILLYKMWLTIQAKKQAFQFYEAFQLQKSNPLSLDSEYYDKKSKLINPFLKIYQTLKKQALDLLAKNKHFNQLIQKEATYVTSPHSPSPTYLSLSDIDYIASYLSIQVTQQVKELEKNLYILSTTVSLAPFLGLLGTVWGILTTFSQLQSQAAGNTHDMVLNGLSLALATTVLGLLDAIPALIGYNYLKNSIHDFAIDMEGFSNEVLAAVELQYRKVDI